MKDKELHDMDNFCLNNYDSLNDFMFYKYMCEEGNEKQQKIFLQSLGINIKGDLLIKSERVPPDIEGNKERILDFIAETEDKTLINIELQVRNTKDFNNRIVYYLTRLADTSLKRGENYNNIKKVIVIAIVNYKMNELQNYSHIYQLVNIKDLNDVLTQKLEIRAIELKKFRKFKKDFKDKKTLILDFY